MGEHIKNRSIEYLEKRMDNDPDPFEYAVDHENYYRGMYDPVGIHFPKWKILKDDEVFMNGKTGIYTIVGRRQPFKVNAISVEEARKRIAILEEQGDKKDDKIIADSLRDAYCVKSSNLFPYQEKYMYVPISDWFSSQFGEKNLTTIAILAIPEDPGYNDIADILLRPDSDLSVVEDIANQLAEEFSKDFDHLGQEEQKGILNIFDKIKEQFTACKEYNPQKANKIVNIMDAAKEKMSSKRSKDSEDKQAKTVSASKEQADKVNKSHIVSELSNAEVERKIQKILNQDLPSKIEAAIHIANEGIYAKREERIHNAIQYYQKVVQMFPESGAIYYNLGRLFYIVGDFQRAQKAYTMAYIFGANVFDYDLYRHLGHAIEDEHNPNETINDYRDSIMGRYANTTFRMYDDKYEEIGRSHIDELRKAYERRVIG